MFWIIFGYRKVKSNLFGRGKDGYFENLNVFVWEFILSFIVVLIDGWED